MTAMKLKGFVIEKYNNMSNAYTCNRLVKEASAQDIELEIIGIHDTYITKNGIYNGGRRLEKRDFVINRYKWGRLKDRLNELACRQYNSQDVFNVYINKYEQIRRLRSSEFLIPKYILSTAMISYELIVSCLGSPVVAKGLESSRGDQVVLVKGEDDLRSLVEKYGMEKEWLFEEYILTSHGKDIRFYSIRGEVIACMQRKAARDFRTNVALGASVEPYEITDGIRMIAEDIYKQTGLDFLGIDLLHGKEKPYFCEINVMAGIEGIEKASGENIAKKVIETIKGDFCGE